MATVVSGDFEWAGAKALAHLAKHAVTFEEAAVALATDTHELAFHDAAEPQSARKATPHEHRIYEASHP